MTRSEAIKVLRTEGVELGGSAASVCRFWEALDMAISALRKQETVTNRNGLKAVEIDQVKPMTNADRIWAMSDEELNELFHEIYNAGAEDAVSYVWGNRTNNFEWTMEWLQQTAGEEDKHEDD